MHINETLVAFFLSNEGAARRRELRAMRKSTADWEEFFQTEEGAAYKEAGKREYESRQRPDATDRANDLARMKVSEVPADARAWLMELSRRMGYCVEIHFQALNDYARYVEGFPSIEEDRPEAKAFFEGRKKSDVAGFWGDLDDSQNRFNR